MKCPIKFILAAAEDYRKLNGSIKMQVDKKLAELELNPFLGERLGNKHGYNLDSCYKIYIYSKKYRIVYKLLTTGGIQVIEIVGIGCRDKGEIYKEMTRRIK